MNSHNIAVHSVRYTDEVKQAAVARLQDGATYKEVAADIGCHPSNLRIWKLNAEGVRMKSRGVHQPCSTCADLRAVLKLVVETANASPAIRAGVLRIAADAIATAPALPATATPATTEGL